MAWEMEEGFEAPTTEEYNEAPAMSIGISAPAPTTEEETKGWEMEEGYEAPPPTVDPNAEIKSLSESYLKQYPEDPKMGEKLLKKDLQSKGYDIKELEDRTSTFHRFQTGVAQAAISGYNFLTQAEEGDTSYEMETILNKEDKENDDLYEALNFSRPKVKKGTGSVRDGTADYVDGDAEHSTAMASGIGEYAPSIVAGGVAGLVPKGVVASGLAGTAAETAVIASQAGSEQSSITKGDVALSALGGLGVTALAKIFSPKAIKNFTSLADMPKAERKAIQTLQDKSGLDDEGMEQAIKDYIATSEKPISDIKAVEAGARASETEQVGFIDKAMGVDDMAKRGGIEESTARADQIIKAGAGDEEIAAAIKNRTLDNKGRRKATNWSMLEKDLKEIGLEPGDALYDKVAANAKAVGNKDVDIFETNVRKAKPQESAAVEGLTDTARGSLRSNAIAAYVDRANKIANKIWASPDIKTVNIIRKAMKEGYEPKRLEQSLVDSGVSKLDAKRVAKETSKAYDDAVKEDKAFDKKATKEVERVDKEAKKIVSDFEKKQNKEIADKKAQDKKVDTAKKKVTDLEEKSKSDFITRMGKEAETAKKKETKGIVEKKQRFDNAMKPEKPIDDTAELSAFKIKSKKLKDKAKQKRVVEQDAKVEELRKKTIKEHTLESAKWKDSNPKAAKLRPEEYKVLKKEYEESVNTPDEYTAKEALDKFRKEVEGEIEDQNAKEVGDFFEKEGAKPASILDTKPIKVNKNGEPVVPRDTRASDKDIRHDYKETNRPMGDQDLNPEETGEAIIASKKRERARLDNQVGEAHQEEVYAKMDKEEALKAEQDRIIMAKNKELESANKAVESGLQETIAKGKAKGADAEAKYRGKQAEQSLKEKKVLDDIETRTDFEDTYVGRREKILSEYTTNTSKGKKAMKELIERKEKLAEEARRETLTPLARDLEDSKGKVKALEGILEDMKKEGKPSERIKEMEKDLKEAEEWRDLTSKARGKEKHGEATKAMDTAVNKVDGLAKEYSKYRTLKNEDAYDGSWHTYMTNSEGISKDQAKAYYKAHGTEPKGSMKKWLDGEKPAPVSAMRAGKGSVPIIDHASNVVGKKWTQDMTNELATSKDKTRTMKKLFTNGKVTQEEISNIYKAMGKTVPKDITRSTSWK